MPYKSRWQIEVPKVTLPTFLFKSPTASLPDTPVFLAADAPDTHYLTYRSYRLWCQRFAAGLRAAGLKDGDRVLLFSGNTLFSPVVIHGTIMAGAIFTGANPTFVARELAYQLKDSDALFLIAAESSLDTAREAAHLVGMSEDRIFAFDDGFATFDGKSKNSGNIRHWTALIADEETGSKFAWDDLKTEEDLDRTVALNYSSGTTGVPKGVMITHKNYVSNCMQTIYVSKLSPDYEQNTKRARQLCFLPMYHAMGQTIFGVTCPVQSIPVYIMPKFDFIKMLENIQRFKITVLTLVPPIVVALAKHPAVKKYDLSSVDKVGCGAAPLGREMAAELEKLWPPGKINVKQGWGMTEITCSAMGWHPLEKSYSFSVGELNPNCEAKLVDEDGIHEVPEGERGEVWVKAPNVMKGYWGKPEATKETITEDGWLKTGDIAYVEKGKFFIVDRKKELIKVKGNQVAPAELEALLLDHPAISDVAVIGVNIDIDDERPRAYVVLAQGKKATEKEIQEWLATKVTRHKHLTGGVRFVDAIPKNPSGKILRKILREQAKAEISSQKSKL
ncbi:putative 4-coumarate-CoA ligase [Rhizodiscina lignyota]|uniref:4-coumarate-CoA ligase n=1 Tax=Rhizodiscina lignyota TaxID=1504668 RepID=A0A9P4IMV9_9PEZI|nr:putative 4-coumarate-CoA ligase [Rhizodiscina lignyota]